jgi:DNA-binding GntR family transcriptional regulator
MHTPLVLRGNVDSGRLSDAVYDTLLEGIVSGRLPPGEVVSEVALARELQVSRTPVHDALRQLAKDGLVEQRANHRAVVASFSREDLFDIFDMRKLLEGEAARRAATRIDRQTLQDLRQTNEQLAAQPPDSPGWLLRWTDFDEEFHGAIARASGSKRLCQDIVRYRMLHRGFNKLVTTPACLKQALEEHLQIIEALERRDGDTAARALISHIQEWQAYFVSHFPPR